jgi:hypothetical protein
MKMIFLVMTLLILVGLGAVAVHNFWGEKALVDVRIFPDQLPSPVTPEASSMPTAAATAGADWKTFKSKDESFHFRYPPAWQVVESLPLSQPVPKGFLGVVVQSWALTSLSPEGVSSSGEAVKIDFEISTEGRKESLESLVTCEGPGVIECKNLDINGVTYKRVVTKNQKGTENIVLATIKEDRIYRISSTVNVEKNEKGCQQIEEVMRTFEILQSS